MAVIRDVMPVFELFQPASDRRCAGAAGPARRRCLGAGGRPGHVRLAEGPDQAAERGRRPEPDRRSCAGSRRSTAASRSARLTTLTEVVQHPVVREKFGLLMRGGGAGGVAADPQPGHARRQRVAGHALLVLPQRLDVLPRRRQHLLRRHADGDQPRARDSRRRPLRGGEPVGHGAGADRAGRADGDPEPRAASGWCRRKSTSSGRRPTSRG